MLQWIQVGLQEGLAHPLFAKDLSTIVPTLHIPFIGVIKAHFHPHPFPCYTSFRHLMIHHSLVVYFFRDLSSVRAEVTKSVRVVQGACMDLDKNLRGMDANTQSALEEERARCQKVPDTFFSYSFNPLV